jgi:hypothetical protein
MSDAGPFAPDPIGQDGDRAGSLHDLALDVRRAIDRAAAFLERSQLESGEIPVLASTDPAMAAGCAPDSSVFPTAAAVHCLSFVPAAAPVRERACAFLRAEMDGNGLWRHWTRDHPHHSSLPPDLDDTSCASAALAACGTAPDNRSILLDNRTRFGLFLTWVLPRLRWTGPAHRRAALPQLAHLATLFLFFRRTSAAPSDVDAVVNANSLFYLGGFEGRAAVVAHLLAILRDGRERCCDKWYENPFVIWYFLARALGGSEPEAAALIGRRLDGAAPSNALEAALAACARLSCGSAPSDDAVAALLALQSEDGSWPRAPLYHGGRRRRRDGAFDPPHPDTPRWGSEALTTAFALEALSRSAAAR